MASTCLNEQGWHPDLIEFQLAPAERNEVRAAYNRAQRLAERQKILQSWGNYLDTVRAGAKVIRLVSTDSALADGSISQDPVAPIIRDGLSRVR